MSMGMGMADGGEVAPGAPKPTHIEVHVHQEPVLNLNFLLRSSDPDAAPHTPGSRRVLVASWVVQIVLGLLSGFLGGLGCITFYNNWFLTRVCAAGIWTGVVAALAGVVVFIYEKRGGTCWALLRTLLALAAFATAIAAISTGAYYFQEVSYEFMSELCDRTPSWRRPLPTSTPEEASRLHRCLSYLHMATALSLGLQVMLLSIWVLLLLTSLAPLFLYCWRRRQPKEEKDQKPLLGVSPI